MADVSKIGANGIEYDVADTAARLGIQTANANIASLREDLTADETDIANLQSDMTTAQGDITTIQGNVSALQTALENEIVGAVGYCKMADGTLILRGTTNFTSGSMVAYGSIYIATVTIALPSSPKFINSDYTITGSSKWSTGAELAFGQGATSVTQASVRVWDVSARTFSTNAPLVIKWMAIGRWK